ncbi:MAG: hypothetical protein HRT35_06165 [Algicola sp.]|nr:hypothetical protein [Algicola sp.]
MSKSENDKTTRVQMELPKRSMERLKYLKDETEASSYAEVTKNAYRLYELLIEKQKAGHEFVLRSPDGELTTLELFV